MQSNPKQPQNMDCPGQAFIFTRRIHAWRCASIHAHTANKTEFVSIQNTKLKKNPFIILRLIKKLPEILNCGWPTVQDLLLCHWLFISLLYSGTTASTVRGTVQSLDEDLFYAAVNWRYSVLENSGHTVEPCPLKPLPLTELPVF